MASDVSLTSHPAWYAVCVNVMPTGLFLTDFFKHYYTNKAQSKPVPVHTTLKFWQQAAFPMGSNDYHGAAGKMPRKSHLHWKGAHTETGENVG